MENQIKIEHTPGEGRLDELGVKDWPIWEKGVSEFPWTYNEPETCYILQGEAEITPEEGMPVYLEPYDLVFFPQGMKCTWKISDPIKKHYRFG